ncbi:glycosyltransferase [Pontibacter ummariensis]|nr:glycosyltransferase [Pontibacter ummariensis]
MIKEQTRAFCQKYREVNVGISIWGQQEQQYLLWSKDHFKNVLKVASAKLSPSEALVFPNLKEYHKPAFTWSNKIAGGNMGSIVKANLFNLKAFEADYGKADLIHAQVNHPAGRIAMEVAKAAKLPFCVTERMSPFPSQYEADKKGKLKSSWKAPYTASSVNITISPAQAALMQKQGISNIRVIPNFLNEAFFVPASLQTSPSPFVFLTLTTAIPRKGVDVLLKAIEDFTATAAPTEVTFRIGGNGNFAPYKEMAQALGIADRIEWFGQVNREEALKAFQESSAFVLPSFEESFGNVYAEAIACGKPVIATKCGGPESIVNETNGLLVEKDDPKGLATAIRQLINNYSHYDSHKIRRDFMSRFSSKAVLPQLHRLYQEIISKQSNR